MSYRVILTLVALAPNPALAQRLSFGPVAGVTTATWRGADLTPPPPDFRTGSAGGAFIHLGIYKSFGLETQLLYAGKGMEETTTHCTFPNTCQPYSVSYTQHFIEIPLLITVTAPTRLAPTIFAGPAVAFQTSCTFRSSGPTSSLPCDSIFSGYHGSGSRPPTPSMKHKDVLAVLGGGFQVGPFAVQARYELGRTKFLTFLGRTLDYKTRAWLMTASYRLSLGRR